MRIFASLVLMFAPAAMAQTYQAVLEGFDVLSNSFCSSSQRQQVERHRRTPGPVTFSRTCGANVTTLTLNVTAAAVIGGGRRIATREYEFTDPIRVGATLTNVYQYPSADGSFNRIGISFADTTGFGVAPLGTCPDGVSRNQVFQGGATVVVSLPDCNRRPRQSMSYASDDGAERFAIWTNVSSGPSGTGTGGPLPQVSAEVYAVYRVELVPGGEVAILQFHEVTVGGHCQGGTSPFPRVTTRLSPPLSLTRAEVPYAVCGGTSVRIDRFSLSLPTDVPGISSLFGFSTTAPSISSLASADVSVTDPNSGQTATAQITGSGSTSEAQCPTVNATRPFNLTTTFTIAQATCNRLKDQTLESEPFQSPGDRRWFHFLTNFRATLNGAEVTIGVASWYKVEKPNCQFTVSSITGEVAYRRNEGEWTAVVVPQTLCNTDELFTGVESTAVINGAGDSGSRTVKIEELTQILLDTLVSTANIKDVMIRLKVGELNAKVKKEKVVDTNFEVQTPTSTTSVRGTIFNVRYDEVTKASTISVEEGEVVVTGAKAPFPITNPPGLPVTVRPGQRVSVTASAVGTVGPNPGISVGGVVDAAGFRAPLARGEIASVFGTNFTTRLVEASTVPLPLELGGASVRVNGVRAPLFFVSPGQINFQVPQTVPLNGEVEVVVASEGAPSLTQKVAVQSYAPGIFTYARAGVIDPIVVHADGTLVTPSSAAARGEALVIYATGVGDLTDAPRTNQPALVTPLAQSRILPEVTIGGAAADVLFAGPTPGFIGLIQINVIVPAGTSSGSAALVVKYGTAASQPGLALAVR